MNVLNDVGERLTRLRVQAGRDVEAAARETGVPAERIEDGEAGAIAHTDAELDALANAYGVDPSEIFGGRITPVRDYAGGA